MTGVQPRCEYPDCVSKGKTEPCVAGVGARRRRAWLCVTHRQPLLEIVEAFDEAEAAKRTREDRWQPIDPKYL